MTGPVFIRTLRQLWIRHQGETHHRKSSSITAHSHHLLCLDYRKSTLILSCKLSGTTVCASLNCSCMFVQVYCDSTMLHILCFKVTAFIHFTVLLILHAWTIEHCKAYFVKVSDWQHCSMAPIQLQKVKVCYVISSHNFRVELQLSKFGA